MIGALVLTSLTDELETLFMYIPYTIFDFSIFESINSILIKMNETESDKLVTISGKYTFCVGEMFESYEELEKRLELHCSESLVYYWRRDTRK